MMLKMMMISGLVLMMVAPQTCQEENRVGVQLFEAGLPPDGRLPPFHHNDEDDDEDDDDEYDGDDYDSEYDSEYDKIMIE